MISRLESVKTLTAPGQPYEIVEIEAIGRQVRAFKNAPVTLRDIYETTRSAQPFVIYEEERLTFEQTWRRACTLAHILVYQYGVRKGDKVAISMRNYPEWIIAFMAATSVGAVAVAMNALWQAEEMRVGLATCGSKILICDGERLDRLMAGGAIPDGLSVIATRLTKAVPDGVADYDVLMDRPMPMEMVKAEFGPDDDAIMLFTSGSTGAPKGAVSTHRMVVNALLSWELDYQTAVLRGLLPPPVPNAPQGAALLGIPLFHVTGLHAVYLACYRHQRRLVSMYRWDAAKAAELIEKERITHFTAPAAVTGDLVEEARRSDRDLSTLVALGGGGASRAPEQVRAIDAVFQNARPGTGWGMTETNAIGTGIGASDYLRFPESSGQVSAVLDIRIADPDGNALPVGERGELQIKGVSIMRGYHNRPDANAETFLGEWMKTGDVAYLNDEGFMFIVDRIKDLVIRGGENIGCGAVEAALVEHPAIIEACVYGVPDPRLGEEVAATVYANAPVTEAEIISFLEPRLGRFQIPRVLTIVGEPLPRGATGKIAKRELRGEAVSRLQAAE